MPKRGELEEAQKYLMEAHLQGNVDSTYYLGKLHRPIPRETHTRNVESLYFSSG